jgi:hypothetical protein
MRNETLLHRQINPSWIQEGRVTSQAFKPTSKDKKQLSVYDGDQISAEEAWHHYTESLHFLSAGVMAVVVSECQDLELEVKPDPEPFPEHAIIDFSDLPNVQIEKKAKNLREYAQARGYLYFGEAVTP